ncbi:MAG: ATPase, T2SS/T4P/T4SS family, partial [Candidatus Nanohaloarchaea archaeon]
LAEDVVNLLHRHGIIARERTREVDGETYYRVVISGKEQNERFLEEIGFTHERKEKEVEKRIEEAETVHTNVERVPCRGLLSDIKEEEGLTNEEIAEKAGIGRRMVDRILAGERIPSRDTVRKLSESLTATAAGGAFRRLQELANGDVFWDRIAEVQKISEEEAPDYVYDVTVDGTHTFAAGSSPLFVHNTTFLNSIVSFIPPEMKITSIEDTRELQLPHENWIPSVTRSASGQQEEDITMYELLRESFRQNPDYVVVGEVRGEEASVLFQGMASGHPSLSTMHASDPADVVSRLTTDPINLSPALVETLDMIVSMTHAREWGENARRVQTIYEIEDITDQGTARTNEYFSWTPVDDSFSQKADSNVLDSIQQQYGLDAGEVQQELRDRKKVLEWMHERGYTHFEKVSSVVSEYYKDKSTVMAMVSEETEVGFEEVVGEEEESLPPEIEREREELERKAGRAPKAEKGGGGGEGGGETPRGEEVDYEALLQEPAETVKEEVNRKGLDPERVLELERSHQNRESLVDWLEEKTEREQSETVEGEEEGSGEEEEKNEARREDLFEEDEDVGENPFE